MPKGFQVCSFSHAQLSLDELSFLQTVLQKTEQKTAIKHLNASEYLHIITCNRMEFWWVGDSAHHGFLSYLQNLGTTHEEKIKMQILCQKADFFQHKEALQHVFELCASLKSMVLGEREILTQVKQAYQEAQKGDVLRILVQSALQCAKKIFIETKIAEGEVSVVSLAYKLFSQKVAFRAEDRIAVVGAGTTNKSLCKFLKDAGYNHFTIYNRSLENAEKMAEEIQANAFFELDALHQHIAYADILITCMADKPDFINIPNHIKAFVDLAIPCNIVVDKKYSGIGIQVKDVQARAVENLSHRAEQIPQALQMIEYALQTCLLNLHKRKSIQQLAHLPKALENIKQRAFEVFDKDIAQLSHAEQGLLQKFANYLEEKYIALPMKTLQDIAEAEWLSYNNPCQIHIDTPREADKT